MNGATLINRLIVLIHLGPPFSFIVFLLFIPVCCHPLAIFVIFLFFFYKKKTSKDICQSFSRMLLAASGVIFWGVMSS